MSSPALKYLVYVQFKSIQTAGDPSLPNILSKEFGSSHIIHTEDQLVSHFTDHLFLLK